MKSYICSMFALAAVAIFSLGCEGHNFAETQELHKSHGHHEEGAHGHGEHASDHKEGDAHHGGDKHNADEKKKAHH